MVKVSIIMATYNCEDTLRKSIDSILAQTFKDWEFIICDDGSTDNTYQVLSLYADKDSRIRIIKNDSSKGLAYSLNRCIKESKGDIIARQDADDASDTARFEIQYEFVKRNPEYTIVGTCWYNCTQDGQKTPVDVPSEPTALDQVKGGLYMHPSWMMRKEQIEKVGLYTVNKYTLRSQDYHLVMKVLGVGMKLYNMPERLYYYTVDDNTMKRSLSWPRVKGLMWIRWDAYRRNHLPLWCYIYVFKPLIANLLPKKFMMSHYKKVYNNGTI